LVNGPPTNFTRTYTTSSAKVDQVILPFEAVDTTSLSMIKILSVNAPRGRTLGAIVSFLSVGVLNTVFGYSLYAGLIYLGANLYLAQLVGRLIGLCFNFYSYQYIALRDRRLDPVRFVLAYAIGYVVAVFLLWFFYSLTDDQYIAGALCLFCSAIINFMLLRGFASVARSGLVEKPANPGTINIPTSKVETMYRNGKFRPYPIDWRFLPEKLLLVKDFIRHLIVKMVMATSSIRMIRPIWIRLIASATINDIHRAGVLFIHIPKTAGTSICALLYDRNLPHFTADFYQRIMGTQLGDVQSFAVIRHPIERFVSAYRFVMSGGSDIMLASRYERAKFYSTDSLNELVDFLLENRDCLGFSLTFRKQVDYVLDAGGRLLVDQLYPLTDATGLSENLMKRLGVKNIPHLNRSHPCPITLSDATLDKLALIYEEDFALFRLAQSTDGRADIRGRLLIERALNVSIA